jgi:phosphoketolase
VDTKTLTADLLQEMDAYWRAANFLSAGQIYLYDNLVMDAIGRLPQTGDKGIYLKQQLKDKLVEHKQYIDKYGEDLPEIRN